MATENEQQIYNFLETLFGSNEGQVYAPTKKESATSFTRYYFAWPSEKDQIIRHMVQANKEGKDVWIAPALLKTNKNAKKTNWLGTQFLYVDFDAGVPKELPSEIPEPSIKIQSSVAGREHWYWKLNEFYTGDENRDAIEAINKSITYALGADRAGWDATQVLRAPGTKHRSKGAVARILSSDLSRTYNLAAFSKVLPAPSKETLLKQQERDLPDILTVLSRVTLKNDAGEIFNRSKEDVGDRSAALYRFASECLEVRPPIFNTDILTMLNHLCYKWGKFETHSERFEQVKKVLASAIAKHDPKQVDDNKEAEFEDLKFLTFPEMFAREAVEFEWIYKDSLAKGTLNVLASLGGVGKTSLAMQMGMQMATQKAFLNYKFEPNKPIRSVLFSFEMPEQIFNLYTKTILKNYTEDEQQAVAKNWFRSGLGYQIPLWDTRVQAYMMEQIALKNPEVVFIDSIKYAGGMDEKHGDLLFSWVKRDLIAKQGLTVYFIHHVRKPSSERPNSEPTGLEDLYGDAYIGNIADSVTFLWKPPNDNGSINYRPVKSRTHSLPDPFMLKRTPNLLYIPNEIDENPIARNESGDIGGSLFT